MSQVRSFRADSMQEALKVVRREMGADAVILHTRQITHRRRLPWRKPKQEVEITAGLDVNVRQPTAGGRQFSQPNTAADTSARTDSRQSSRDSTTTMNTATVEMAKARLAEIESRDAAIAAEDDDDSDTYGPFPTVNRATSVPGFGQSPVGQTADRPTLPDVLPGGYPSHAQAAPAAVVTPQVARIPLPAAPPLMGQAAQLQAHLEAQQHGLPNAAALADKLDSIQKMLADFGRTHRPMSGHEIPDELFQLFTDLIDVDVEEDLAREFVFRLKEHASPEQLRDAHATKSLLAAMVESELKCCGPIQTTPGRRKVVALVGPTGVGKTTTIAKLAANFRLRDSVKMGLVTVDTYRIAAVEQLRTYAEIIDLPMKVVTNPLEMRRALDELMGLDLILVDTAGRSPRDDLQIQELKSLLNEAHVDEVHLVLSLTSSSRGLKATADKFATANVSSLILTKLDEAPGLGGILSAARQIPFPVSYVTTGQDVPSDIEPAHASRLARLVLGQDRLF
ncbi:MAG: flagellar biosynthesis protein FlhF [Planctomycetota bacterium]|nr:flagellar biosynthesis protein FlhF [Planctomycetota bacterium]